MNTMRAIWSAILQRCNNPRNTAYRHYGGRGIRVCARWLVFDNFLADMGARPTGKSIDRIDNSKGYEPSNCRWAGYAEQSRNRRSNVYITHAGRTLTVTDWAAEVGLCRRTIRNRLKAGWSVENALFLRDTRGLHMQGTTRPEWVRQKISAGLRARK